MRDDFQNVVGDLVKRFTLPTGSFVALDGISFQVREGEFFRRARPRPGRFASCRLVARQMPVP